MDCNAKANSVVRMCCAAMLICGMCRNAVAGDIAVTNLDSTTHEIALSLTAPGHTTLKNGLLSLNKPGGILARSVPPNTSWELLIWKRQSASDPWTFSRAYTVGEMPEEPGRTTLLISPSMDQVTQAVAVTHDPQELDPLPPIPDWQETPSFPSHDCCPPVICCPPVASQLQWSAQQHPVYGNGYPVYHGNYQKSQHRRMLRRR